MQYFIWWFVLLPFILPKVMPAAFKYVKTTIVIILGYVASYGLWLYYAYELEFKGLNTMYEIFIAGIVVFVANIVLIVWHIYCYSLTEKMNKEKEEKSKTKTQ